jgi:hypothetical protein
MAIVEETFREIFGDKYDELFENQPRE